MAEARRYGLTPQLDIEKILLAAQDRWLRPAEICEILQNYKKFHIASEPPNRPPSGSLLLFDRKILRYFRKDGHNWRKKKDGKTVKEAHERLKAGSIDVLHCYYAHGEDSNFQRRTYWMLEEEFLHIVLVHYRKVKNKESYVRPRDVLEITQTVLLESPSTSNSSETYNQRKWQATNAESPNSIQTSDCEDSERDFQESSRYNPLAELLGSNGKPLMDTNSINPFPQVQQQQRQDIAKIFDEIGSGLTVNGPRETALTSWDEVGEYCEEGCEDTSFPTTFSSSVAFEMEVISRSVNMPVYENGAAEIGEVDWQNTDQELDYAVTGNFNVKNAPTKEGKAKYHPLLKQLSLDFPNIEGGKGLQKHDSFSSWMSKELGEVNETHIHAPSTSGIYWEAVERESIVNGSNLAHQDHIDTYLLSPSLSQYQLFSIDDFSPNWTYSGTSSKILIAGSFLLNKNDIDIYNWSCMFGEVEVPAEVLADGLLQCHAPPRKSGRVPFYITCSNRLACSEVRDFEYRDEHVEYLDTSEPYSGNSLEIALYLRFEKFLSEVPPDSPISSNWKIHTFNKISSLLTRSDDGVSQKMLKEKLHAWLLHKVAEDGKGPNILDKEGQGVIHLAAALGYDWAIPPTIVAGVNINFRDKHGWTALHWAASCGREHTVVTLLSLRASPGLLTDPTTEFPSGRTPADLAAKSGHKGIAGFLAQSSLTSHLSSLTLKQSGENSFSDIFDFPNTEELAKSYSIRVKDGDALKDSLGAVRSATQAAARIHQVFRVQSFHRKEQVKYGDDKFGISNERAISLLSVKPNKANAAIRIQNKFRGWKGRKEFLIIRQRIVKIQAHVRGHQVRKHFRKFVWTVAIVMKAIRRWRGKESGLREFRSERSAEEPGMQVVSAKEDDYDLLQAGRKQTEARSERALERVKSMVQYQESRDQYRRLLIGVEEFQETKVILERILNDSEETSDNEMLFDIDELLEDDNFMLTSSNSVGSSAC